MVATDLTVDTFRRRTPRRGQFSRADYTFDSGRPRPAAGHAPGAGTQPKLIRTIAAVEPSPRRAATMQPDFPHESIPTMLLTHTHRVNEPAASALARPR